MYTPTYGHIYKYAHTQTYIYVYMYIYIHLYIEGVKSMSPAKN